jgi:hypothetical protein
MRLKVAQLYYTTHAWGAISEPFEVRLITYLELKDFLG